MNNFVQSALQNSVCIQVEQECCTWDRWIHIVTLESVRIGIVLWELSLLGLFAGAFTIVKILFHATAPYKVDPLRSSVLVYNNILPWTPNNLAIESRVM